MNRYFWALLALTTIASISETFAQKYPERRYIRKGNDAFERGNYVESEVEYRRSLEKKPDSYEAAFNLAGALYKQERYADAQNIYQQLAADSSRTENAAMSHYNNGNTEFQQKKYQEAIEAYKNALRLNPDDQQAKFNLAYAKKKLDDQQNKDNKDNKDKKEQDKKEQEQKPQPQDQQQQDKEQQDKQQQPQSSVDKEQAERMLEAMQNSEDKTREKVNAQRVKSTAPSGKNW